jgi:hypothetical protein
LEENYLQNKDILAAIPESFSQPKTRLDAPKQSASGQI